MALVGVTHRLMPSSSPATPLTVLSLNQGSSSLKFGLYAIHTDLPALLTEGQACDLDSIKASIVQAGQPAPDAIGHRIVHGGFRLTQHCLIDDEALRDLEAATCFAPLHSKAALALIRMSARLYPTALQVACFDTQFHRHLPDLARILPIPRAFEHEGIRRYGFHGLSCESIVAQLGQAIPSRLVIAHLGSGASITAVQDGRSIDTSMGLTPCGGVVMGTRTGDLDPGLVLYLLRSGRLDMHTAEAFLNQECRLLGISDLSADIRVLQTAACDGHADADLAIRMFCYSVQKQIAAMIAALGGVDMLVFTAGIGEHNADVRARVCAGLAWTGARLDELSNARGLTTISAVTSAFPIRVLTSMENERIAAAVAERVAAAAYAIAQTGPPIRR